MLSMVLDLFEVVANVSDFSHARACANGSGFKDAATARAPAGDFTARTSTR